MAGFGKATSQDDNRRRRARPRTRRHDGGQRASGEPFRRAEL